MLKRDDEKLMPLTTPQHKQDIYFDGLNQRTRTVKSQSLPRQEGKLL
jgi:hypothetical protein